MTGIANAVNGPEAAPYIAKAGGTMTGALILNTSSPSTALQAASKGYVDSVATGLNVQPACYAGSTGALTATYSNGAAGVGATLTNAGAMAAFSIDGVSPPINSRILIKDQASTFENGIYTLTTVGSGAANWVLTRATDYDEPSEIQPGDFVLTVNGSANGGDGWVQTATVATVGTDPIVFTQFSGGSFAQKGANSDITSLSGLTGGISKPTFMTMATGGSVRTDTGAGNTALLQAYDVDGAAYTTFGTLTANNTPTFDLSSAVTLNSLSLLNVARNVTIQVFDANGTYTPNANMIFCMVYLAGAGGGSGGAAGTAGQLGASGGGGGGGYSFSNYTRTLIGASAAVVIGAGGTAGAAGNNNGGTGGTSTFTPAGAGTPMSCVGGLGGAGAVSTATSAMPGNGGTGGAASGGSVNISGSHGTTGVVINGAGTVGLPAMGGGCPGFSNCSANYAATTVAPNQPGQGAPGVVSYTGANQAGQAGGNGKCIVVEILNQ